LLKIHAVAILAGDILIDSAIFQILMILACATRLFFKGFSIILTQTCRKIAI
jgi:hypothetical protein